MITLQNFETTIASSIIKVARGYFEKGKVSNLEEDEDNHWTAQVNTSKVYDVEIKVMPKGKVKHHSCECMYLGELCPHIIAVLFAILEVKKGHVGVTGKLKPKNAFDQLLALITQEEYQQFIRKYASRKKDFKIDFELFFAHKIDGADTEKKYQDIIRRIITRYQDRGFIHYRDSALFAKEVKKLVNIGLQYVSQNNFVDAFNLAKAIFFPVTETIAYSDDSGGHIGDSIYYIISLFSSIAETATAVSLKEEIYSFIKNELDNETYFAFGDFGYEMTGMLKRLAVELGQQDDILKYFDNKISQAAGSHSKYYKEFFQQEKIDLLTQAGRTADAELLISQNLNIVEVREAEVNKAVKKRDYAAAKKLINEGIVIARKNSNPGTIKQWEEQLLKIAQLENDIPVIRKIAKAHAFDQWFSQKDYRLWKSTFTADEWQQEITVFIDKLIAEISKETQKNRDWFGSKKSRLILTKLAPVYIEEGYFEKIMELVEQEEYLDQVLVYHSVLYKHFPERLMAVYIPLIRKDAESVHTRSQYAALIKVMKKIEKDIPSEGGKIKSLAGELRKKYDTPPRRPAMVEELLKHFPMTAKVVNMKGDGQQEIGF